MLNSFNSPAFQISCLRFLNTFVQTASTTKKQIQIHSDDKWLIRSEVLKGSEGGEYETLLHLKMCVDMEDGVLKISEHSSNLYTVSVCVMYDHNKYRVLATQLLARMPHVPKDHTIAVDPINMLRLKFGEPVRFKFIIG